MNVADLIAFEADIAAEFNAGNIRAPVHLAGGNEQQLIDIFKDIRPQDWIAVQWRSHYHCLLKGVPPAQLKVAIMAGQSITLNFPEHRIVSSAIAGGHLPIALGIAHEIKRQKFHDRVYAFLGDMTAMMGVGAECMKYAAGFDLPVVWVVEGNGKSVMTNTAVTWGAYHVSPHLRRYEYTLPWPHAGAGKRVNF